ncbi:MAG: ATP-binding protein [Candidatus Andersenbacteria bacterium]|nr:ATP-binding protein [Candidatus Andersenbacteria bacterium]
MKICVIGAPSTGKSSFARSLSAEMMKQGMSCELVQEYGSTYVEQFGAPAHAWEQLAISVGQYLDEQKCAREYMVTDGATFATYVYAQRLLPKAVSDKEWPKYRHLLDVLRIMARRSLESYDLIFLLTHVFTPSADGVRLKDHLSKKVCQQINRDLESYLRSERIGYHRLKANATDGVAAALKVIRQQMAVRA